MNGPSEVSITRVKRELCCDQLDCNQQGRLDARIFEVRTIFQVMEVGRVLDCAVHKERPRCLTMCDEEDHNHFLINREQGLVPL